MLGGHVGGAGGIGPAWTHSAVEKPAGVKNMGTWKALYYTEEQQARLRVTAEGKPRDHDGKVGEQADAVNMDTWKKLVGQDGEEVVKQIAAAHPQLNVVKVHEGHMMTMDFDELRVRVFVDESGKVSRPPKTG